MAREYDKLVRDRIPEIIRDDDERPIVRHVDGEAYHDRLIEKLDEEVAEYRESGDVEELADVLEVIHALCSVHGIDAEELEAIREEKAAERGRFDAGIILKRVEE